MIDERTKNFTDAIAMASGGVGTLTQWSDAAGELTPIFSLVFVVLSIIWLAFRLYDRLRFGPKGDKE